MSKNWEIYIIVYAQYYVDSYNKVLENNEKENRALHIIHIVLNFITFALFSMSFLRKHWKQFKCN